MTTRRALLLAGASAALSGCGIQTWVEQPGRRIFRNHTLYRKWGAEIVAFTRGNSGFFSLESPTDGGEAVNLCRVDLDRGKATLVRRVDGNARLLAASNNHAFVVMAVGAPREPYLHRVSLRDTSEPEKLFPVPSHTFLVADVLGAWTYRIGRRSTELVRVTDSTVETVLQNVEPAELTIGPQGLFFESDRGLEFLPHDGKPTVIAKWGTIPIVTGGRTLLLSGQHLYELAMPGWEPGKTISYACNVPGKPCAAMFGGVLFSSAGSWSPSLLRDDPGRSGVVLDLWEADAPGWERAMDIETGRMLFGAVYGPSYLVATDSSVIAVS